MMACNAPQGKHLFLLSGQSNMARLNPAETFTPTVAAALGEENVIVIKHAVGGQPIRRWCKDWKPLKGDEPQVQADLYDSLMIRALPVMENETIASVTFLWMQGERDAREGHGEVYEKSLLGIYQQLGQDLNRDDINFVIGRLSDFDLANAKYPHWTMVRDIQVKVAESNPRFDWINTDDMNDGIIRKGKEIINDLHMSDEGYLKMGERFGEKAIQLIAK